MRQIPELVPASRVKETGTWLDVLPISSLGLRMDDKSTPSELLYAYVLVTDCGRARHLWLIICP